MNHIFELSDSLREPKVCELGGKGVSLVKLTRGGFCVPEGFIVMSTGFDEYVHSCDLITRVEKEPGDINEKRALILSLFAETPVQRDLVDSIQTMLDKINSNPSLPTPLLAVRSSGVTEDLDEASFAGMNDTILNVPTKADDVCEAVKKCWLSLYGKRSIVYRQENGFPPYNTSIAVVVQVMIPSEASGVVFTSDPQTGSRGEISLDGVQGLGESLVSGMVDADHWLIRKPYNKRKMFIEESRIGRQQFKLVSNYPQPGTTKTDLSETQGKTPAFTQQQIEEITQIACRIEKYYMKPMDIEFCFYHSTLYIVQARPITNCHVIPDYLNPLLNKDNPEWSLWISFNSVQMVSTPFTPAGVTTLQTLIGIGDKYITSVSGYLYVNVGGLLTVSFIRKKLLNTLIEIADKEIGRCAMEFYKEDYPYYKKTVNTKPLKALYKIVLKNALKSLFTMIRKKPPVETLISTLNELFDDAMNKARDLVITDVEADLSCIHNLIIGLMPHYIPTLIFGLMNQNKIRKILDKYSLGDLNIEHLWGNRPENIASQLNHSIMKMGITLKKIMKDDPDLSDKIHLIAKNKDGEMWLKIIESFSSSSNPDHIAFSKLWEEFIFKFGHRGPGEIDIAAPRYSDSPSMVLNMILNIDSSHYLDEEALIREREETTKKVLDLLKSKDRKKVEKYLPYAQLTFMFREHPKYLIVTFMKRYRDYLLKVADELVSKSLLEQRDDVFFLPVDMISEYVKGNNDPSTFKKLVKDNKAIEALGRSLQFPRTIMGPECILRMISKQTREELKNLPPNTLAGLGASAGVVEGVAVVCTDPETAVIKQGEILVAPATDPGWTPLFVPAAAAVIEIGGALTHGSVVAREMGIPCVVSIQGLLSRVKTGMRLRVDGSKGLVEILEYSLCSNKQSMTLMT